jgi:hypothetical protein
MVLDNVSSKQVGIVDIRQEDLRIIAEKNIELVKPNGINSLWNLT